MNRTSPLPPLVLACALAFAPAGTAATITGASLQCADDDVTYVNASWSEPYPLALRNAQDPGREDLYVRPRLVWLDPASNLYRCGGDPAYGKTRNGEYMSEDDAKANGARAFQGRKCG
jgi:hypothetical protein